MATLPDFTYTGRYEAAQSSGNWELRFLSSGTLTLARSVRVDAFLVGRGGDGAAGLHGDPSWGGGGGGGGECVQVNCAALNAGTPYEIQIGGEDGHTASTLDGGGLSLSARKGADGSGRTGGAGPGGRGGGGSYVLGLRSEELAGSPGAAGTPAFGESGGRRYGPGGGGGQAFNTRYVASKHGPYAGGETGGGSGGDAWDSAPANTGKPGAANSGGGGGGGGGRNRPGGAGGSGIVLLRNTRCGAASFISAGDGVFGAPLTITLNRDSATATHTVVARLLAADGVTVLHTETVAEKSGAYPTLSWTPALSLYGPLIPDRASAQFQMECITYDEGGETGTEQLAAPITLRFRSEDVGPVMGGGAVSASPYNSGAAEGIAGYVQGYSRAQVSFSDSAVTLKYGASIAARSIRSGGVTVSAAPYRTPVLTGGTEILCRVTDSRGFHAETALQVSPLPYRKPALSGISIFRCDAAGAPSPDGAWISAKANLIFSPLDGENSAVLTAALRPMSGGYGGAETIPAGRATVLSAATDPDLSYMVKLSGVDALGGSAEYEQKIPLRKWAMKFRPDGEGVAFGKAPAAGKTLEIPADWEIVRDGAVLPWSVADGSVTLAKLSPEVTAVLGGIQIGKLWENASPSSFFGAQTVSMALMPYEAVEIVWATYVSDNGGVSRRFTGKYPIIWPTDGSGVGCLATGIYDGNAVERFITFYSDGIVFDNGAYYNTYGGSSIAREQVLVPLEIYGIKGVT